MLIYYRPQTKLRKVMFLHLSVILFTGGGLPLGLGVWIPPSPRHTPLPLWTRPPLDTPLHSQQAGGTHPTGMHSCWYLCLSRCLSRSVNAPLQATLKVYNRTCFERTPQSVAGVRGITAKLSSHVQICFERTSNTYTGRIQIIGIAGQELSWRMTTMTISDNLKSVHT